MIRISFPKMKQEFERVLLKVGFTPEDGVSCAKILAENTLDGVSSHGINRFALFVSWVGQGIMDPLAKPLKIASFSAWEQWDGKLGPGPLNAQFCTNRAIELARQFGIGLVSLRHTTHWMRGGAFGWQAVNEGFAFIGWTNTQPNMPPWGAKECKIGNNPLIFAMPRKNGHVVLDMAMSLFSYGKMETMRLHGRELPFVGGYDTRGKLTKDPSEILETWRPLPIGYWKGSGLSILLDVFASVLSNGFSTHQVGQLEDEYNLSQIFLAIDVKRSGSEEQLNHALDDIIADLHSAVPATENDRVRYPGEGATRTREENLEKGIPVDEGVWEKILAL